MLVVAGLNLEMEFVELVIFYRRVSSTFVACVLWLNTDQIFSVAQIDNVSYISEFGSRVIVSVDPIPDKNTLDFVVNEPRLKVCYLGGIKIIKKSQNISSY